MNDTDQQLDIEEEIESENTEFYDEVQNIVRTRNYIPLLPFLVEDIRRHIRLAAVLGERSVSFTGHCYHHFGSTNRTSSPEEVREVMEALRDEGFDVSGAIRQSWTVKW